MGTSLAPRDVVANDELSPQRREEPLEGPHVRSVPAALESRDRGGTGADPTRELLLGDPEDGPAVHHQFRDRVVIADPRALGTVCRATPRPSRSGTLACRTDRTALLGHVSDDNIFGN